ncbi:MAG TPA: 30S ribosomal protein S17 [Candidatus Nanoarchaeia archaeon]|nr:30S ribosomal protein S17 [uncultured archaeon]
MQGKVVSTKMNKTVVVEIERWVVHPIYKKRMKRTKKLSAHNELPVEIGNIVELGQTKPFSKTKNFIVKKVITERGVVKK